MALHVIDEFNRACRPVANGLAEPDRRRTQAFADDPRDAVRRESRHKIHEIAATARGEARP